MTQPNLKEQLNTVVKGALSAYYYNIEEFLNSSKKYTPEERDRLKHKLLEIQTQTLKNLLNES